LRHNKQKRGATNTSARNVKKSSRTKKKLSTTSLQWLTYQWGSKDGTSTPIDCIVTQPVSKSSAQAVTEPKQKPNEQAGLKHDDYAKGMEKEINELGKAIGKGVKHDLGKPPLAYIPKAALEAEGMAFAHGARKYYAWNYKNGLAVTRTLSAAMRHILQFLDGEDTDSESGAHHLGCARANLAMALDTLANHPELDDRHKGGKK
jgi:hypothetical protein